MTACRGDDRFKNGDAVNGLVGGDRKAVAARPLHLDIFAFYAWTRTDDGWKMFALSDIVVPA